MIAYAQNFVCNHVREKFSDAVNDETTTAENPTRCACC